MTAITQENKLGQRFIGASDFLRNGIPASMLATFVSSDLCGGIRREVYEGGTELMRLGDCNCGIRYNEGDRVSSRSGLRS